MNVSTLCRNLGKFGPVTREFMMIEMITFGAIQQCHGLIFAKFIDLVGIWLEMIDLTFVLPSPKERCYGNQ